MRLATIDVGTNTALLLISEWNEEGLVEVFNATGFVRLGEGMDASGRVSSAALLRLQSALFAHMEQVKLHSADHVIITGTSASRDAADAHRIRSIVKEITGQDLTILSGDEEALVTFLGATAGLRSISSGPGRELASREITVVDVGGGSTEVVQGTAGVDGEMLSFKDSIDMGSVRMTERYFTRQPALESEIDTARTAFRSLLDTRLTGASPTRVCVGASGTARILSLIYHDLFDLSEAEGLVTIPYSDLKAWSNRLLHMEYDEVMSLHPTKMKGRADVLPAGSLILTELLGFVGAEELVVSPFGVRHGVAIRYFRESGDSKPNFRN